jgi:hypothetical protein
MMTTQSWLKETALERGVNAFMNQSLNFKVEFDGVNVVDMINITWMSPCILSDLSGENLT